ncbi:MAG: hypothetical protein BJ554DRAFT_1355 [Olpidium bornovanus]|uniref:Uncharacterized protein n=1 Tax=Olpidium bornovanus TaxID=278681 RepID=A0A8H7ZSV3_9FUNG|nr:MAG: hypothetical protein BJ554DRAFT_1355 [Olpidium bornovanus]
MPARFAAAPMEDRQQLHRLKQRPQCQPGQLEAQQHQHQQPLPQFRQAQDSQFASYGRLPQTLPAPQQPPPPPRRFAAEPAAADSLQSFYIGCAGRVAAAPAPPSGPGRPQLGGHLASASSGNPLTRSTSGTPESPPEAESHKKLRSEQRRTKVQQGLVRVALKRAAKGRKLCV